MRRRGSGASPHLLGVRVEHVCGRIERRLRSDPRFAHTRSFLLTRDGDVVWEAALGDGEPGDVFSVTKTVLALLVGAAIREGAMPADPGAPLGSARGSATATAWREAGRATTCSPSRARGASW